MLLGATLQDCKSVPCAFDHLAAFENDLHDFVPVLRMKMSLMCPIKRH